MGVMLYFRESELMEAAYGFFICITMLMTTTLIFGYLRFVRKWALPLVLVLMALFFTVEFAYFVANVVKITATPVVPLLRDGPRGRDVDLVPRAEGHPTATSIRTAHQLRQCPARPQRRQGGAQVHRTWSYLTKADRPTNMESRYRFHPRQEGEARRHLLVRPRELHR